MYSFETIRTFGSCTLCIYKSMGVKCYCWFWKKNQPVWLLKIIRIYVF